MILISICGFLSAKSSWGFKFWSSLNMNHFSNGVSHLGGKKNPFLKELLFSTQMTAFWFATRKFFWDVCDILAHQRKKCPKKASLTTTWLFILHQLKRIRIQERKNFSNSKGHPMSACFLATRWATDKYTAKPATVCIRGFKFYDDDF